MANSRTAILVLALVVPFLVQISLAEDCGKQAGGALCAPGICCSEWGWCGITAGHCGQGCQSQCSGTPSPPPSEEECGIQAGGAFCSPGICCSRWGFCGITDEHCGEGCQSGCPGTPSPPPPPPSPPSPPTPCGSGVAGIVSSSLFDQIFPKRDSFYTYEAFISAANSYAGFGTTGNCTTRKQEFAAIFAQFSHETTGLLHIRELNQDLIYCEESVQYPCASGQKYFGRGPMQLSWNYNYKMFGDSIGVDLVNNPDLVATDPVISFKSAIWFWMTPQYSKPSCHDVMTDGWTPTPSDIANGRTATFGTTTLIINGGLECGPNPLNKEGAKSREIYYNSICGTFGVSPGSGTLCNNMTPFWLLWNVQ